MKSLRDRGVTYYIIDKDYDGKNKAVLYKLIDLETLFINDITIMYDWESGLSIIEDNETYDSLFAVQLPALFLTIILTDDEIHEWMHRSMGEDRIEVDTEDKTDAG